MRKGLKIILSIVLFIQVARILFRMAISLFGFPAWMGVTEAGNRIQVIDIQVHLNADGSATILEQRRMDFLEGTEVNIELSNLGPSELLDFNVVDFEEEPNWDKDSSMDQKAFKYGVIEGETGPELAWGMNGYGHQYYGVSYTLSNVVRELVDGQALFWNFDSFQPFPTKQLTLEVFVDADLEDKLVAFDSDGYTGEIALGDDTIQLVGASLDDSDNINVLLQFAPDTFQTDAQVDMNLAEQREMLVEGATYNATKPKPQWVQNTIKGLVLAGIVAVGIVVVYVLRYRRIRKENNHFNPYQFVVDNKEQTNKLPQQVEESLDNYIALFLRLAPAGEGFTNLFAAYLLFWKRAEKIQIEVQTEANVFRKTKHIVTIQLENFDGTSVDDSLTFKESIELFEEGKSSLEEVMWNILLIVADVDGRIEGKTLKKWLEKNSSSFNRLSTSAKAISKKWLVDNYYLDVHSVKNWGFSVGIEELTPKGEWAALSIVYYHNFIENNHLAS